MKAVAIQDALRNAPFIPFNLHIDTGGVIAVNHPECLMFNQPQTVAVVVEGEHVHLVDIDHVGSISYAATTK